MWYRHTKNPISLINFLHGSQKGPTLPSLNSISALNTNFHLLIDLAAQWTDRHFFDLSLTVEQKEKCFASQEDWLIIIIFLNKNLCGPYGSQPQLTFHAEPFVPSCQYTQYTNTGCSLIVSPSHTHTRTHRHTLNSHLMIVANRYDRTLWGDAR